MSYIRHCFSRCLISAIVFPDAFHPSLFIQMPYIRHCFSVIISPSLLYPSLFLQMPYIRHCLSIYLISIIVSPDALYPSLFFHIPHIRHCFSKCLISIFISLDDLYSSFFLQKPYTRHCLPRCLIIRYCLSKCLISVIVSPDAFHPSLFMQMPYIRHCLDRCLISVIVSTDALYPSLFLHMPYILHCFSRCLISVTVSTDACRPDPDYPDEVCCGLFAYSPDFDNAFCCNGIVVPYPSGCTTTSPAYDINKQVCLYGQTIIKFTDCPETNNTVHYCCGGTIETVPLRECVIPGEPDDRCCHLNLYSIDFRECCGDLVGKSTAKFTQFYQCFAHSHFVIMAVAKFYTINIIIIIEWSRARDGCL